MAILMLPMMAAPALVGLMYRLILHEFVGVLPDDFDSFFNDSPSFLGPRNAFWTLVAVETLRQYCGQLGKQDNCQVAVSLSITHRHTSLPVAYQLSVPKTRRRTAHTDARPLFPGRMGPETRPTRVA